jgi:hypothetical protein
MSGDFQREQQAALYALDALPPDEARELEQRMTDDPELRQLVDEMRETGAAVALVAPAREVPPDLKKKALNQAFAGTRHGMEIVRATEGRFRPTPFSGVTAKRLFVDPVTGNITWLLRMEPGSRYPAHRHSTTEQCLVVTGDVGFGEIRLGAGDFQAALGGTIHDALETINGCQLLILASPHDEFVCSE